MAYITKNSTFEKIFRVSSIRGGESIIEVPSLLSIVRIDVGADIEDLRKEAKELYSIGTLNYVNEQEGMDTYLSHAMKLDVILSSMNMEPGKEILFHTSITTFPAEEGDPETLGLAFRLSLSEDEEVPTLLPDLIDTMTGFIMLFNHRLIDSSISLN